MRTDPVNTVRIFRTMPPSARWGQNTAYLELVCERNTRHCGGFRQRSSKAISLSARTSGPPFGADFFALSQLSVAACAARYAGAPWTVSVRLRAAKKDIAMRGRVY